MKVRIYRPHTHGDTRFDPPAGGMEVDLPAHDVDWLKKHTKVLEKPDPEPASATPA